MDARKILQKINLILYIEAEFNLQSHFNNIFAHYTSNNPDALKAELEIISNAIEDSEINNFVYSDLRILEGLGIRGYFDLDALENLKNMLRAPGYEAQNQLNDFVSRRAQFVQLITQLKSSLEALDIDEEQTQEIYQIVLSLPGKYQDLNELENFLGDIKAVLQELNSKARSASPPKIASVNNGSIEFFIEVAPLLAEHMVNVFDNLLTIYGTIEAFKQIVKSHQNFSQKRKAEMNKIADAELESMKEKILDEYLEQLSEKDPEAKTRLKKLIFELVKHIENGVHAEVKTPEIDEPEEIEDGDDPSTKKAKREELKKFAQKKAIAEINKRLFLAQKEGLDLRLLNPRKEDEEQE